MPTVARNIIPDRPSLYSEVTGRIISDEGPSVPPRTDPDRRTFTPEPHQLRQLRDYVAQWVPGADPDHLVPISCTYTTTPDHDFVLDRRGRVVVAAGFSGHGFKFAPAVGRVLADLASDAAFSAHPAFAAARFAALPA